MSVKIISVSCFKIKLPTHFLHRILRKKLEALAKCHPEVWKCNVNAYEDEDETVISVQYFQSSLCAGKISLICSDCFWLSPTLSVYPFCAFLAFSSSLYLFLLFFFSLHSVRLCICFLSLPFLSTTVVTQWVLRVFTFYSIFD